ncbi:MAG: TGS domain-containing protein [Dehalococcoidia bacterium]|nr:TGS domain-containing protein [Dehalococcoidia bacterium]
MPANLPPQYFEAEKRFRAAKDVDDKIAALQEMLGIMPHHKGTDKLQADLRSRIAKLTQESERKLATARRAGFYIRREGAGQVILTGPPNSGKSQLLASLTGATPAIAMYPFTTKAAMPGMMKFEDIQIQLVDTPPLGQRGVRALISSVLRAADLLAIVVDLGQDPLAEMEWSLTELRECRIVPPTMPLDEEFSGGIYRRHVIVIGNKSDLSGAYRNLRALRERYESFFPVVAVSATEGEGMGELPRHLFKALKIIRVYTKAPGQKADMNEPVILPTASTVGEAAAEIHKDFKRGMKYAVVWGSGKYQAQTVSKAHILQDGDVVEFHV